MKKTVITTFDKHQQAENAVKALYQNGFAMHNLSIIGKGFHSAEQPLGFYTMGDKMKSWGGFGAFWGSLWGLLIGSAFFWVPGIGMVAAAGPFIHIMIAVMEGAALGGGISVIGAALSSWGVPKHSIIKYEKQIKANEFLLLANGDEQEIKKAKDIIEASNGKNTQIFTTDN